VKGQDDEIMASITQYQLQLSRGRKNEPDVVPLTAATKQRIMNRKPHREMLRLNVHKHQEIVKQLLGHRFTTIAQKEIIILEMEMLTRIYNYLLPLHSY
jgi:hypothetical protein